MKGVGSSSNHVCHPPESDSVNIFLSKLLSSSLHDLRMSGCVMEESEDPDLLEATNGGRIASFYYLSHLTIRMLHERMHHDATIDDVLQLLSDSQEYHELPVRHNEDAVNCELANQLPVRADNFDSPHTKALLLLSSHFLRAKLPSTDYVTDLKSVLDQAIRVLQAFVDASADRGWIVTSIRCMQVIQMVSQAINFGESHFLSLPFVEKKDLFIFDEIHFRGSPVLRLPELMAVYQENPSLIRDILMQRFRAREVDKICHHLTSLPEVTVDLHIRGWWAHDTNKQGKVPVPRNYEISVRDVSTWVKVHADQEYFLVVNLKRKLSKVTSSKRSRGQDGKRSRDEVGKALCPRFPKPKLEGWFLVLADREKRELCALKRISTLKNRSTESISFVTSGELGRNVLTLYLISDSYVGLDQLYDVRLDVIEPDIASQINQEVLFNDEKV